jgi:hypothetical protein
MATPLENLQAAAALACAKLTESYVNARPEYTLPGGPTLKLDAYRARLMADIAEFAKMPGVLPELVPVFEANSVMR